MSEEFFKLLEHNNWANLKIIRACSDLSGGQLDAEPQSATRGSIRRTLMHHATEHREQINSMLSALGVTPFELDGWSFGEATKALVPISG